MSLRFRLLISIALALLASFALSLGLACWNASRSVRIELAAAMHGGAQAVRNGIEDFAASAAMTEEAARLVATFDGNRHVRAALLDRSGKVLTASHPLLPDDPPPGWFMSLTSPGLPDILTRLPPPDGGAIRLSSEPVNEAGEAWVAFEYAAAELLAFCVLAAIVMLVTVGRAMRPLARLVEALDLVGPDRHGVRVPAHGPTEVASLAEGFNRMGERLAAVAAQNDLLHQQVLTLQDEERAEFARDLHDEIGPFLFSINVTAATIDRLARDRNASDVSAQVGLIREDVSHMQRHVRAMLERLQPASPVAFGLTPALLDVLAFWRDRHPDIVFDVSLPPSVKRHGAADEVAYRVVQEAISNALRHGRPRRVSVSVQEDQAALVVDVRDDGGTNAVNGGGGFGLAGMRQRVAALDGTLFAGLRQDAMGWQVTARLPHAAAGPDPVFDLQFANP